MVEFFKQPGVIPAFITGLAAILGIFLQGWYLASKLEKLRQLNTALAKHQNNRRDSLTRLWHAVSIAHSAAAGMVSDSASADGTKLITCTTKFLQEISLFLDEAALARQDLSLLKQDVAEVLTVQSSLVTLFLALDLDSGDTPVQRMKLQACLDDLTERIAAFESHVRKEVVPASPVERTP